MDDYTRYTWAFFLVDQSDVFAIFKSFVKVIHNEFKITIKRVRSDNDSEFNNTRIDDLCDELELDINSWLSTLHNQMALLKERIEQLLTWHGLFLVSTM
jgi:putative methionine-R-sulfoxide reductase with GAF domain